jgi:hypothetical protein
LQLGTAYAAPLPAAVGVAGDIFDAACATLCAPIAMRTRERCGRPTRARVHAFASLSIVFTRELRFFWVPMRWNPRLKCVRSGDVRAEGECAAPLATIVRDVVCGWGSRKGVAQAGPSGLRATPLSVLRHCLERVLVARLGAPPRRVDSGALLAFVATLRVLVVRSNGMDVSDGKLAALLARSDASQEVDACTLHFRAKCRAPTGFRATLCGSGRACGDHKCPAAHAVEQLTLPHGMLADVVEDAIDGAVALVPHAPAAVAASGATSVAADPVRDAGGGGNAVASSSASESATAPPPSSGAAPYDGGSVIRVDEDEMHEFKEVRCDVLRCVLCLTNILCVCVFLCVCVCVCVCMCVCVCVRARVPVLWVRVSCYACTATPSRALQVSATSNPVSMILSYTAKYVTAFLNHKGGTIFFGVADNGVVRGVALPREARDILRREFDARMRRNVVCATAAAAAAFARPLTHERAAGRPQRI